MTSCFNPCVQGVIWRIWQGSNGARDGIETVAHELSETALEVLTNPRRVRNSATMQADVVELQDAAAQTVCDMLPSGPDMRILEYCAGYLGSYSFRFRWKSRTYLRRTYARLTPAETLISSFQISGGICRLQHSLGRKCVFSVNCRMFSSDSAAYSS